MKTDTKKYQIKRSIRDFFEGAKPGNEFFGLSLIKFVRLNNKFDVYPDTVLRYLREMKERKLINFDCVNRQKSLYVLK
jgi:hypothetical protein